ncbi:catechol O-methyltransferase-like [Patiria miniata]|uniref:catechol O-methyltransferase n=1 Tax=Patiria miniata TaxID=46514 RepID=A0A913Z5X5_PATMI|nr:catechol O-methyltransferase-like [Patiria miniata]
MSFRAYLSIKVVYTAITQVAFPKLWRDWWYWNTTEDRLLAYVKKTATEGDPASVLAAVEKYNRDYEWTIMLEPDKTKKLEEVVKEASPEVCLEMGCYIGCSALAIGAQLPPGGRLITTEIDPRIADIARQLISFAGLDQVITVCNVKAGDLIQALRSDYSVDKLDFVFLDHFKQLYHPDLKRLEANHLLRKGTVVMADNTVMPGAPDFLEYVETSDKYKTERFEFTMPVFNELDAMTVSVYTKDY